MHLAPRVQAAQLEARATSEPTPKRRQKEPKTEGGKGAELAGYAILQKRATRRRQLRTFASCHERTSVFARPATLQWVIGNR